MSKHRSRRRTRRSTRGPVGAPPGMLVAHPEAHPTRAALLAYDANDITEIALSSIEPVAKERKHESRVLWLDVVGLKDVELVQSVGKLFELHSLALEDVLHAHQRAKAEDYPSGYYLVLRMPTMNEHGLELEQVSIFLGERYVVTFQEREGDCFEPVRNRLRQSRGRLRALGADYLAYALLDAVVDAYFPLLEEYGDRLEEIEDRVIEGPTRTLIAEIHGIKRELSAIRRAVWPLREVMNVLLREESGLIGKDTRMYLRDAYDHTIQVVELVEANREIASGLLDVYLSSVSNRMNEVMKVLTIIATIFMPLGFLAGLYGMNFDPDRSPYNMPELGWRYGYPFALSLMAVVAVAMLVYFRRKRWL